jgi:hypothetical protein
LRSKWPKSVAGGAVVVIVSSTVTVLVAFVWQINAT